MLQAPTMELLAIAMNRPVDAVAATKGRKCTQRHPLANSWLFLNPIYSQEFSNAETLVFGQIKQCPATKNNWQCQISWKVPVGMNGTHFVLFFTRTLAIQTKIDAALDRCDEDEAGSGAAAAPVDMMCTPNATEAAVRRAALI